MDGRGIKDLHKCGEEMSKNSSLPSREQQETSELNGSGGGRGKGIRGPRPFVPVGDTNRDKRPMSPLLARLAVGPGTKATYCPGPKGYRDKWPGTNACSVVVSAKNSLFPWEEVFERILTATGLWFSKYPRKTTPKPPRPISSLKLAVIPLSSL